MNIEINIRLDVRGRRNSLADCDARALQVIGALCHGFSKVKVRRHCEQVEDNDGVLHLHDSIVAAIDGITIHQRHEYRDTLHALASAMEQDCLAVYYPFTNHGELIGPHAEVWSPFNPDAFVRF